MRRTRVKKCNILFSLLFIFTLFLVWSGSIEKTYAYTPKSAVTVSAPGVLVETKVSPSMSAAKKRGFYSGKPLTLLSETIGDDGYVWYLAEYALASNGAIESSYIRSDFVQITGEVSGGDTGGDTGVTPPPSETTGNVYATAICNGINVNIRSKAGTGADCQKLVAVNVGQTMDVFGETTVGGNVWYNVTCNVGGTTYTGWIIGLFIDITPDNGAGFEITSDVKFSASALPFSPAQMDVRALNENQSHSLELKALAKENVRTLGKTYVNFDLRQMGLGCVNSWGQWPIDEYMIPAAEYEFFFALRPVNN